MPDDGEVHDFDRGMRAAALSGMVSIRHSELEKLVRRAKNTQAIVDEQAEDEGLWFIARTAPEAYLQQELRRLHEAIEGVSGDDIAHELLARTQEEPDA